MRKLEVVRWTRFGDGDQIQCRVRRSGVQLRARGVQGPADPVDGIGSQMRRTRQKCGSRRDAATRPRPLGPAGELVRNRFVGIGGRLRAMPGPKLHVVSRIGRVGERLMHASPIGQRGSPVDRRAHQRVPEVHPGADRHQPRCLRRSGVVHAEP